jgi:AcrR family transcriptional regulator
MAASKSVSNGKQGLEDIFNAILACTGEVGFTQLTVEKLCEHPSVSVDRFDSHFEDLNEGFVAAYEWKANHVADLIIREVRGSGSAEERIRSALMVLSVFANREPAVARAVVGEVHAAGLKAQFRRREVLHKIVQAVERKCLASRAGHSAVATKAEFVVAAIDQAYRTALTTGGPEDFERAIPDLVPLLKAALSEQLQGN